MRSILSSVLVVVGTALALSVAAVGCQTSGGAGGAQASSRGEKFFQMKCNACHPNGGQGAGPPIEADIAADFLERGKSSGRHAVPEAEWEPLIAFVQQRFGAGAVAPATAVAAAPVAPVAGTPAVAPVATATPTPAVAAPAAGDATAGGAIFAGRCQKCHAGGRKIGGAAVPGVLQANGSGKHGVAAADLDNLVAYLVTLGAVRAAPAAAVAAPPVAATPVAAAAPSSGDAAAGGAFFTAKCNKCHAGGRKIVGNPVPGPLTANVGGKHGVPGDQMENLLAYLVTLGGVRAGSAPVTAAPTGVAPTTTVAPPPPPPSGGGIPMTAGMVPCNCACQCPPGAPPEALPAACVCKCACAAQ